MKLIVEVNTAEEQCLFHKEIKGFMEMDWMRKGGVRALKLAL